MDREDNVEQRFPEEGHTSHEGKGAPKGAEEKKGGRSSDDGGSITENKGADEEGKGKRKRTTPRPRIARKEGSSADEPAGSSEGSSEKADPGTGSTERPRTRTEGEPIASSSGDEPGRAPGRSPSRSEGGDRGSYPRERAPYDPNRYESRERRPYDPSRNESRERRPYDPNRYESRERRPYDPNRYDSREQRPYDPNRYDSRERRPYDPNRYESDRDRRRPYSPGPGDEGRGRPGRAPYGRGGASQGRGPGRSNRPMPGKPRKQKAKKPRPLGPGEMYAPPPHPEGVRINRYIANAGVCSRREADKLVEKGEILVNGVVVDTLGARIDPGDVVTYKGVVIKGEKLQYILLNKPKNYITTNDDPEGRATVMELLEDACEERVFPVGRLDRNTTGLILFTNDGIMAEKLMHPRNLVKKLYHIRLDKPLDKEHMRKISMGIKLEDGWIKADQISYVGTVDDRTEVGLEIHSGKNRIVRRIFEHFGYEVVKLDRVMFAGLTKKDLRRGKWRHLTPEELNFLNML